MPLKRLCLLLFVSIASASSPGSKLLPIRVEALRWRIVELQAQLKLRELEAQWGEEVSKLPKGCSFDEEALTVRCEQK